LWSGKAKSNAKTELEKLKMKEMTCAELIKATITLIPLPFLSTFFLCHVICGSLLFLINTMAVSQTLNENCNMIDIDFICGFFMKDHPKVFTYVYYLKDMNQCCGAASFLCGSGFGSG
jgi:hypothetical protein